MADIDRLIMDEGLLFEASGFCEIDGVHFYWACVGDC